MLMIRLQRVGRKNIPIFRVVLTDSRNSTKSGKYLETLGMFDPVNDVKKVDAERVKHWISKGAQPSDTLHNFLVDQKIIEGKKINKLPKKRPIKKEEKKEEAKIPTPAEKTSEAVEAQEVNETAKSETVPAEVPKEEVKV